MSQSGDGDWLINPILSQCPLCLCGEKFILNKSELPGKIIIMQMNFKTNYSRLRDYILHYKWWFMGGILSSVIFDSTSLIIPWILKLSIESLKKKLDFKYVTYYVSIIVSLALFGSLFRVISRYLIFGASRYIENDVREDLFSHLLKQSSSFYQKRKTGDIISRATNDLTTVRMFIGFGMLTVVSTCFTYIFAATAMITLSLKLTLFALLPYPIIFFIVKIVTPVMFRVSKKLQEQLGDVSSRVQENVSGIHVVKSYVQEENEENSFLELNIDYFRNKMKMVRIMGTLFPLMGTLGGIGTLIILWQGGRMVILGEISLGDFVAFNGYLALLIWPSIALGWIFTLIQRGLASFERICEILRENPTIADNPETLPVEKISGELELRDLNFSYPAKQNGNNSSIEVLKNINLKISKGEFIAVVGRTGAGKSTLAKLILRLLEIEEGRIFIDGIDITKIPLNVLRKSIGYVPQESFLFNATIRENIAYGIEGNGLEGNNDHTVEEASAIADLSKDVENFPKRFETLIGERGINISGGQKQRISLARTIILPASVLVFDDPLSSVDADTEKAILERIKEMARGITTIFITHRIPSIKDADRIIVMENGEIREIGTHEELMALSGTYYDLYNQQLLIEELEEV